MLAPGEFCYIDYAQDAPFTQPLSIGGYTPLRKVYSFDTTYDLSDAQQRLLLGVQANLWAEYIPTSEQVEYMLYPRVLALAEVGWSQPAQRNYDAFRERALVSLDRLRAQGYNPFDLRREYGERPESLQPVDHLARGKKVTYNTPWHKSYPAARAATLTDGVIGGWTYGDRRWQGFLDADFDVTVDLEHILPVHYIGATFMQSAGPYVWMPCKVEISVSDNGVDFRAIATLHNDISPKTPDLLFRTFAFVGDTQARYVRYVARSGGIPGGWLFADEIVVQ